MLLPDSLAGRELVWHKPIRPMEQLKEQAAIADRSIEKCWWFRPVPDRSMRFGAAPNDGRTGRKKRRRER